MRVMLLMLAALLVGGCQVSLFVSWWDDDYVVVGSSRCIAPDCAALLPLVNVDGIESLVFSDGGRLFVSGASQVYEVQRRDGAYVATPLADPDCHFTGLAISRGVLYAACADGELYAGYLVSGPELQPVHSFVELCTPRGMAAGPDDHLYVVSGAADGCETAVTGILRLRLNSDDPLQVDGEEVWLAASATGGLAFGDGNELRFPNGLRRESNRFYGTDGGSLYRVEWLPGGSAGEVEPLFFTETELGDIGISAEGIYLADTALGRLLLVSRGGRLLQAGASGSLAGPVSVRSGRSPMFYADDLLVAESERGGGGLSLLRQVYY